MAETHKDIHLCPIDDISDPGARGFEFGAGSERLEYVAVRKGDLIRVYVNACPHQGTPLETFPDRFLTADSQRLLCTTHGAEFRLNDGLCLKGPCEGKRLKSANYRIQDGELFICKK